jgi:hypothetical protein
MATWGELIDTEAALAEAGRAILYQFGVGLAFMSTVRPDGGPRLHPMCPLLTDDAMCAFIIPSPKQADLRRDGRYALHSFPRPDDENAVYITGTVSVIDDLSLRRALSEQFVAERSSIGVPAPADADDLVTFDIEMCMVTTTTGHGDATPNHQIWRPPTP